MPLFSFLLPLSPSVEMVMSRNGDHLEDKSNAFRISDIRWKELWSPTQLSYSTSWAVQTVTLERYNFYHIQATVFWNSNYSKLDYILTNTQELQKNKIDKDWERSVSFSCIWFIPVLIVKIHTFLQIDKEKTDQVEKWASYLKRCFTTKIPIWTIDMQKGVLSLS